MVLELFVLAVQKQSTTDLMCHFTAGFISMLHCHETKYIKVEDSSIMFYFIISFFLKKGDIHS